MSAPAIVLVRPQLGQNIGKAARAMLNFGLTDLRLVAPRDGWPNPDAGPAASGADLVLERARLFDTVEAAIADCSTVFASTVRRRDLIKPAVDRISRAISSGPTTGTTASRRRTVEANTRPQSAIASAVVSKTCAFSSTKSAPLAAGPASGLGQPSRGATSLSSVSPKLSIARAALPIFWPSWGRTRMMIGGAPPIAVCCGQAGPIPFRPAPRFRRSRPAR